MKENSHISKVVICIVFLVTLFILELILLFCFPTLIKNNYLLIAIFGIAELTPLIGLINPNQWKREWEEWLKTNQPNLSTTEIRTITAKYKKILRHTAEGGYYLTIKHYSEIKQLSYPDDKVILHYLADSLSVADAKDIVLDAIPYPQGREYLIKLLKNNGKVLNKLPYPEEKELIRDVALNHKFEATRRMAIKKLPYPQETETLIKVLTADKSETNRSIAMEKIASDADNKVILDYILACSQSDNADKAIQNLVYPKNRDVLIKVLSKGRSLSKSAELALKQLPYPEAREAYIELFMLEMEDSLIASKIHEKFSYPQDRDILVKAAIESRNSNSRYYALNQLPYPQERDTLKCAALEDTSSDCRKVSLEKLDIFENTKVFKQIAAHDESDDLRLLAIEKLYSSGNMEAVSSIILSEPSDNNRNKLFSMLSYPKDRDLLIQFALKDVSDELRMAAINLLPYPQESEALAEVAARDDNIKISRRALRDLPWLGNARAYCHNTDDPVFPGTLANPANEPNIKLKAVIASAIGSDDMIEYAEKFCDWIELGIHIGSSDQEILTRAGWAAAAMGRIISNHMSAADIPANTESLNRAVAKYNTLAAEYKALHVEAIKFAGKPYSRLTQAEKDISDRISEIKAQLDQGLGIMMLKDNALPLMYMIRLLKDTQIRIPRFIKQGIIMGLVDWLADDAANSDAADLLKIIIAVRADMIQTDNELSFFEVRVPSDSSRKEYAAALAYVLHCSNPSVQFCDTEKLLDVAEKNVPGCMEMLRVCPLRLIDPVNAKTLGFYQFKPYVHAMWVQYTPPLNTGKVIARFHEVDDKTQPLSSGLNIRLFTDPYSVIPTVFHEYQHFTGDPNEASVFLKTQKFSIAFYKANPEARADRDGVFATLTQMLGMPPSPQHVDALNNIILQCYGKQISIEEAEKKAVEELNRLNVMIALANQRETWDKDVKFPAFTEKEDSENMKLIRDVTIRFNTVPKSITVDQFTAILSAD